MALGIKKQNNTLILGSPINKCCMVYRTSTEISSYLSTIINSLILLIWFKKIILLASYLFPDVSNIFRTYNVKELQNCWQLMHQNLVLKENKTI